MQYDLKSDTSQALLLFMKYTLQNTHAHIVLLTIAKQI